MVETKYILEAIPKLSVGLMIAIGFTFISLFLSISFGLVLTFLRSLNIKPVNALILCHVTFIRGTPLLVQLYLIYYLLPEIGLALPPFVAGLVAFVLNSSAIMHEVLRGGITSISIGQQEAAYATGMSGKQVARYITFPQALIKVLPQIISEFTILLKATPLLAFISIVETFRLAQLIYSSNYRPIEVLIGAAVIFFFANFSISKIGILAEKKLARRGY